MIMEPKLVDDLLRLHLKKNEVLLSEPTAWAVGSSSLDGRGLFATRNIDRGELIFIDAPLLLGPKGNIRLNEPMCVNCYKSGCPLFSCDKGCGLPVCSDDCENSPNHVQYECKYLTDHKPNCGSSWSIDLLRTVVPIRSLFLDTETRNFMAAFPNQRNPDSRNCREVDLLKHNVTIPPNKEEEDFMNKVSGILDTTSFETIILPDNNQTTSVRGLYPMGAIQNHCCVPNTRHHFDKNQRLYVNAAHPIVAGEEITMSYTSLFWDTTLRRRFLQVTKGFLCRCNRCCDPTEFGSFLGALLCASDQCPGILLPHEPLNLETVWICNTCETHVNCRQIQSIRAGLSTIIEEVIYKNPRRILKFIEKELSSLVPSSNYLMIDMKFRIISYFGRTEGYKWSDLSDTELKIKFIFCEELLEILDTLNVGDCQKKGLLLYEMYCTNAERFQRLKRTTNHDDKHTLSKLQKDVKENEGLLEKALDIFQNDISAPMAVDKCNSK